VLGAIVIVCGLLYIKRNERRLIEAARREMQESDDDASQQDLQQVR
jgi:hypothetical protein